MKSRKLKLDDSIFDDQTIEIELPKPPNSRVRDPTSASKLKRGEAKTEEFGNNATFFNNPKIQSENCDMNSGIHKLCLEMNESLGSELNFGAEKAQKMGKSSKKQKVEFLNLESDSHLTIKTKKSSKFSQHQFNTSNKLEGSESKNPSVKLDAPLKKTQFALIRGQMDSNGTIKKLTTPPANSNKTRRNFKFDLALLGKNEDKRNRVVYPHSCKNANMAAIMEIQELNRNSPMNLLGFDNDESIDFENIKSSEFKESYKMFSNGKGSEKSDLRSPNNIVWIKKVQEYEVKIERLQLDQKYKVQNYKRMLEERDTVISHLKAELDSYKTKCLELEKTIELNKAINKSCKQFEEEEEEDHDDTLILNSSATQIKTNTVQYNSPTTTTQADNPLAKLKKISINFDDPNERPSVKVNQFSVTKQGFNSAKYQTPNTAKDKKSFNFNGFPHSDMNSTQNVGKESVLSAFHDKSAPGNAKTSHQGSGKRRHHPLKKSTPFEPKALTPSLVQLPAKNLTRKMSANDHRISESAKMKSKKLKISETPKMGHSNPTSFFGPAKDFFAHYKKDATGKVVTSSRDIKALSGSVKSKEPSNSKQEMTLEVSHDMKDGKTKGGQIKGQLSSVPRQRPVFGLQEEGEREAPSV